VNDDLEHFKYLLLNPVVWLFAAPTLAISGFVYRRICRRSAENPPTIERAALRQALIVSWLAILAWTLYILMAIAASDRSTAILSIIEIPIGSIAVGAIGFVVGWALSMLYQSRRRRDLGRPGAWAMRAAWAVALGSILLVASGAYSRRLQGLAASATSEGALRSVYGNPWTGHDREVLLAIADNASAPPDILAELARHPDAAVRSKVARNPRAPLPTLEELYEGDPRTRLALAVNPATPPSMLERLAADPDRMVRHNLTYNPNVPIDMLRKIADDPQLRNVAETRIKLRTGVPAER
jgi:hypothetical protein